MAAAAAAISASDEERNLMGGYAFFSNRMAGPVPRAAEIGDMGG
jgi:hypothetical protein